MSQSPSRQARRFCRRHGHTWRTIPVRDPEPHVIWVCERCGVPREDA